MNRSVQVEVAGIVQGVGFRPFIFQIAKRYGITGTVANSLRGVSIKATGTESGTTEFINAIIEERPPLARIYSLRIEELRYDTADKDFRIVQSNSNGEVSVAITPDAASCEDCLLEIGNPKDRRFGYLLTTCTNCGPRYSVIKGLPFDRVQTTLEPFPLCEECAAEYRDPDTRRFHAQAINCSVCGPQITLLLSGGQRVDGPDAVNLARIRLKIGEVGLIKSLGGYHIVGSIDSSDAIASIRTLKHRENKPLAMMAASLEAIQSFASPTISEALLLQSVERPIVCVRSTDKSLQNSIATGLAHIGVMLAPTPLHASLLTDELPFIIATSANAKGDAIIFDDSLAEAFLRQESSGGRVQFILRHNRPIHIGIDDSVVRHVSHEETLLETGDRLAQAEKGTVFLRRARGYGPTTKLINSDTPFEPILALGSDLKNTVSVVSNGQITTSPHLGNLGFASSNDFHKTTVEHLQELLQVRPRYVAHDLHPEFQVTALAADIAKKLEIPAIAVQHHHAHFAACLAENDVDEEAAGLILDGFGYGQDGSYWGGEVLIGNKASSSRAMHLLQTPMMGTDLSAKRCDLLALGFVKHCCGGVSDQIKRVIFGDLDEFEFHRVIQWHDSSLSKQGHLQSSSAGRLLDALAYVIGVASINTYEGEAPMRLEAAAFANSDADFGDIPTVQMRQEIIDWRPLILRTLVERLHGRDTSWLAGAALNAFSDMFSLAAVRVAKASGVNIVAMSGGVFANELIIRRVAQQLARQGLQALFHNKYPPGDGCISFGQAATLISRQNRKDKNVVCSIDERPTNSGCLEAS